MNCSLRAAFAASHKLWCSAASILVCLQRLFSFLFNFFFDPLSVQVVSLLKTRHSPNNWGSRSLSSSSSRTVQALLFLVPKNRPQAFAWVTSQWLHVGTWHSVGSGATFNTVSGNLCGLVSAWHGWALSQKKQCARTGPHMRYSLAEADFRDNLRVTLGLWFSQGPTLGCKMWKCRPVAARGPPVWPCLPDLVQARAPDCEQPAVAGGSIRAPSPFVFWLSGKRQALK